jgi:hypothetical protein
MFKIESIKGDWNYPGQFTYRDFIVNEDDDREIYPIEDGGKFNPRGSDTVTYVAFVRNVKFYGFTPNELLESINSKFN